MAMTTTSSGNADADRKISYERAMEDEANARKMRKREASDAQYRKELDTTRADRQKDMDEGRARGEELFGDGALGRLDDQRSDEVAGIIADRKANLAGYTPEELNAMKGQADSRVGQAEYMAKRELRGAQGRAGLSGGVAAGQAAGITRAANKERAGADRDIFLSQIEARRGALDKYEGSVGTARNNELGLSKFNLDQKNKELMSRLSTEFGYAGLGASERSAIMTKMIGQEQADALEEQAKNSGGKK